MKKLLPVFLLILISAIAAFYFLYLRPSQKNKTPEKTIAGGIYMFNSSVQLPEVDAKLEEGKLGGYKQVVQVLNSSNSQDMVFWTGSQINPRSSFGFKVEGSSIQISIYVSPSLSQNDTLREVNKNYLIALYYAAESKKAKPSYKDVIPIAFDVFKKMASTGDFVIVLKNK